MGSDSFLSLGNEEFPVVVQQAIQCLKNFARRKVKFVQDEPMALSHCVHKNSFAEQKLARHRVGCVRTDVLLKISMLMVVDSDALVARELREVVDQRCLAD